MGLPRDQLDLPLILAEQLIRPLARRLRDLGLHLWGDLTYQSSGSRAWIPVDAFHRLRLPISYPTSPCPQQPYVNCHGGQFWALRSSPGVPGGIYEILNLPSNPADCSAVLYYRRWVGMSYSRGEVSLIASTSPLGIKSNPCFLLLVGRFPGTVTSRWTVSGNRPTPVYSPAHTRGSTVSCPTLSGNPLPLSTPLRTLMISKRLSCPT